MIAAIGATMLCVPPLMTSLLLTLWLLGSRPAYIQCKEGAIVFLINAVLLVAETPFVWWLMTTPTLHD